MKKIIQLFVFFGFFTALSPLSAYALEIKDVTASNGVHAWLVEDHTVPIIAIKFSFSGGASQDPQGKEGLANLMTGLFDEGAGKMAAKEFQARLDNLGAEMSFFATQDKIQGGMRVLAENRDAAFSLLASAVQNPRFDQDAVERILGNVITDVQASEKDPDTIGQNRMAAMIFGNHPYAHRVKGTLESLKSLTRDDLIAAHKAMFARDNLHIGIVGPISPEEAKKLIDQVFGSLPEKAQLKPVADITIRHSGTENVLYDLPQTKMLLVYPGVMRNDPDFFAAYLMNYILGGSGLSSRLFVEVREKRGLAYSVGSSLVLYEHAAALMIATGTKSSDVTKSLDTITSEVKKLVENGVTAEELADAKSYVIGSYAVNTMGSSSDIASTLVGLQDENQPIDYIDKRAGLINAVTLDDVKRIAQKLLGGEYALLCVGPKIK